MQANTPWTSPVPEQTAFSFLEECDNENGYLIGHFVAGVTNVFVLVTSGFIDHVLLKIVFFFAAH
ncbi:hypothetical protein NP568_24725, partial [Vibrio parahaemolyticus]|nr:hypothetical protein [Vibrio parahaemolyticus]